jgi:hypothetical protein
VNGLFLCLVSIGLTVSPLWAETQRGIALLNGNEVFSRLEKKNVLRAERLQSYSSLRRYAVFEKGKPSDAEIKVRMDYLAPSTKKFKVLSLSGAGWIDRWVFRSLIRAEQDAAGRENRATSAITSANYEAKLLGDEQQQGHDCYVLKLQPKRRDKYLIDGKIWVDKQDFAIVRLEGEPARSLSFWVARAHLVREYQKIGEFWLPLKDATHAQIRFVGEYILQIDYDDYDINQKAKLMTGTGDVSVNEQSARK